MAFKVCNSGESISAKFDGALRSTYANAQDYIVDGIGDEFALTTTASSLQVTVGTGVANICGRGMLAEENNSITLQANTISYLCLRIDLTQTAHNEGMLYANTSSTIASDNLNNTNGQHDLLLAIVTTDTNGVASVVDQRNIKNKSTEEIVVTSNRALVSNANGKVSASEVTSTELGYLDGVTGAIQSQINGKQATLVSGSNIKTVNNTSLVGSGNVSVQPTLVSGSNIKTINSNSLLGSGNIYIAPMKYINPSSVLVNQWITSAISYTATQDCFVWVHAHTHDGGYEYSFDIKLNGVAVISGFGDDNNYFDIGLFVKSGQVVTSATPPNFFEGTLKVFGLA